MKSIKKCVFSDLSVLAEISRETYKDSFIFLSGEEIMAAYLKTAFNTKTLQSELANPYSEFYFLYYNNHLAGYFKINQYAAQTDIFDSKSLEIQRLYIKKEYQNMRLGKYLMEIITDMAAEKDKLYIWLGVWEKNENAIAFYEKNGFYKFSTHLFYMGSDAQTDYIMKKTIVNI
ncbi:MAG: GNAT family N-acetyltransferase [Eubacteriaceae bacterium]|nr:GNAT family N-acetyltransferase [Eubacteriaceae bacterium]